MYVNAIKYFETSKQYMNLRHEIQVHHSTEDLKSLKTQDSAFTYLYSS